MAVLWFGPFYVVVLWTVVSSFLGSTWSARNIYDDYLDKEVRAAAAAAAQTMEKQQELRKGTSRDQAPYDEDGRYLITPEMQNRNIDPDVYITDIWDNQKMDKSAYSDDSSDDTDSSHELWFAPNFQILKNSGQMSHLGEDSRKKLTGLGSVPLKSVESKRQSHSLSIVNPLDVLRQRLMLEMARRRMKENQEQIKANDVILKNMGKRKKRETNEKQSSGRENVAIRKKRQSKDYLIPPQLITFKDRV